MAKSDAATIEKRIEVIYRLILDGWTSTAIVQNASVKKWGLTDRQVRTYIRRSRTRMKKELKKYRLVALDEHIAARRKLRKNASDGRLALDVLKDEAKLLGLYAPEKIEQNTDTTITIINKSNVNPDTDI